MIRRARSASNPMRTSAVFAESIAPEAKAATTTAAATAAAATQISIGNLRIRPNADCDGLIGRTLWPATGRPNVPVAATSTRNVATDTHRLSTDPPSVSAVSARAR